MSSQDLDNAIKSINDSAGRANTTTDFFNRILDGGQTESVQNPLTGAFVPSVQKAVYDQYKNDINQIHQDVADSQAAANRAEAAAGTVGPTVDEAIRRSYAEAGYNVIGTFQAGFTYVNANDVGIDKVTGKGYAGQAGQVPAGTNPASGGFIDRSSELLRSTLGSTGSTVSIAGKPAADLVYDANKTTQAQDWGRVGASTITANDSRILVQRGTTFDQIFVYINHYSNFYQRWEFTRGGGTGDGFDNNVPTHANGNMWMINQITSVIIGPVQSVEATSAAMIKSGTHSISGADLRVDNGYAETTVFGKTVFLDYVARNDGGIIDIVIDGVLYGTLDQYNPSTGGVLTKVRIADNLTNTNHTIRISTTGTKNPASSNTIMRLRTMSGVGLQDWNNVAAFQVFSAPMQSGNAVFKISQAAAELAISSTVNGNSVWSGAYHKNCYPRVYNGQKLYIDGLPVDFLSMTAGTILVAYDLRMIQDLILSNANTPIADVYMQHHFTSDGCNVKTNLTWTYAAKLDRSYQAMWPSKANRAILGSMQAQYSALGDDSYIWALPDAHNALSYHTVDSWISGFYANNEWGMRFENPSYKGMYIWDRSTDLKVYLRKFAGTPEVGKKWNSDVMFFIGHCPNAVTIFDVPTASR